MDAEDFLEADELSPSAGRDVPFKDACDGCRVPITWIDACHVCTEGCTWCLDCTEGHALACPVCSTELRRRPARTRPIR